ncbi:MAG: hypothetical protein ACKOZU_05970 [Planctomycetaceae bacterium]
MARQRFAWAALAAGLVAGLAGSEARAQNAAPFSQTYRRPSVSPYTMLATGGGAGVTPGGAVVGSFNPLVYQQLIQPREDQERSSIYQMQQGRQISNLQNRVQEIQRDTTARQVNEQIRATGHVSTYLNYSHYYSGR